MAKDFIEEFDNESLDMWNNLADADYPSKFKEFVAPVKAKPKLIRPAQINRQELIKLRDNSQLVVDSCKDEMIKFAKEEKYFKANEMRVAAIIHRNLIDRLNNILEGKSAF